MRAIWKYPLSGESKITEIEAPQGAQFLSAALQPMPENGHIGIVVWAMVDPEAPLQMRRIMIVATGDELEDALGEALRHIATAQVMTPGGVEVVHILEVLL